jgi:hypothetical protein
MKWLLLRKTRLLIAGLLFFILPSPPLAVAEQETCPTFNFREVFYFGYEAGFPTWTPPGVSRVITWSTLDSGELNGKAVRAPFQSQPKEWLREAFQSWDDALDTISFSEVQNNQAADIKIAWTQVLELDYESLFSVKAPAGLRKDGTIEFKHLSPFLFLKENFIQAAQSDIGHILGMGFITPRPDLVSVMEWPFQAPYMQIPLGAFDVAVVRALYSESTCVSSFAPAIRAKIKQNEEAKALEQARIQAEIEAKALAERLERERQELYWIAKGKEIAEREAKERAIQKALEEARAKAALPKKKTITCVKGNLTKKVIAVNPKCPSGYKKK